VAGVVSLVCHPAVSPAPTCVEIARRRRRGAAALFLNYVLVRRGDRYLNSHPVPDDGTGVSFLKEMRLWNLVMWTLVSSVLDF